ncbi:hypothetical protein EG68_10231 [Paragonimus skrjabini miyazakii]|uniref:Uncharacterized protein n=1 Tax=Paragonimus skrjabini miyazakii TaxID=59628 RepID=A0A8S9YFT4_9TREM|nr:hypothetical protein EG68_10231 [Paragonimus skrjabini miyazakii]
MNTTMNLCCCTILLLLLRISGEHLLKESIDHQPEYNQKVDVDWPHVLADVSRFANAQEHHTCPNACQFMEVEGYFITSGERRKFTIVKTNADPDHKYSLSWVYELFCTKLCKYWYKNKPATTGPLSALVETNVNNNGKNGVEGGIAHSFFGCLHLCNIVWRESTST